MLQKTDEGQTPIFAANEVRTLLGCSPGRIPVVAGAGAAPYSRLHKSGGGTTPWFRMLRHTAVWAIVVSETRCRPLVILSLKRLRIPSPSTSGA